MQPEICQHVFNLNTEVSSTTQPPSSARAHGLTEFLFQTKAATRRQVIVTASERRRPQRTGSRNEKLDHRLEKEEGKNQPRIKRLGEIAPSGRVLLSGNDV